MNHTHGNDRRQGDGASRGPRHDDTGLARVEARLDAIEARLDRVASLLEQGAPALATVVDIADEAVAHATDAAGHPIDPAERLRAALRLGERVTAASTAAALERLIERADRLEALLEQLPGALALVTDVFDELAGPLQAEASAPGQLGRLERLLRHLASPATLDALEVSLNPAALDLLGRMADAVAATRPEQARPLGLFGAMRRLGRDEQRQALGYFVELLGNLGKALPKGHDRAAQQPPHRLTAPR